MKIKLYVMFSGGLDSLSALQWACNFAGTEDQVEAITFHYGQSGEGEVEAASKLTEELAVDHSILYCQDSIPSKAYQDGYVPFRNMAMLLMAIRHIQGELHAMKDGVPETVLLVTGLTADSKFPDSSADWLEAVAFLHAFEPVASGVEFSIIHPLKDAGVTDKLSAVKFAASLGLSTEEIKLACSCWLSKKGESCGNCVKCKEVAEAHVWLEANVGSSVTIGP